MRRATEIYLYYMIAVFPIVFSPDGYKNIFATKSFFFVAPTLIYLISILILCIIKSEKPRLSAPHFFAIAYLITTAISAFLSDYYPRTLKGVSRFEGLFTVFLYVSVFICISLYSSITKGMIYTLIASNTVFGVISCIQLQGYNPFGLYPDGMSFFDGGVRYSGSYIGTIGNADLVGAYLCIVIPLLLAIILKSRIKFRFTATIPLALLLYTVAKISVSACTVGLTVGLAVAIPLLFGMKKRGVCIYSLSIASLFVISIILLKQFSIGNGTLHEVHEILNGRISEAFGSNRIRIWKNVLSVIPEALLFGKGPDTMILEGFEKFSTFYPALNKTVTTSIDIAHNEYLNVLYHQGIFGLISYLGIIFTSLFRWLKNSHSVFGVCVVAYCAQAFFGFSMCLTAPFFWIVLALSLNDKCI